MHWLQNDARFSAVVFVLVLGVAIIGTGVFFLHDAKPVAYTIYMQDARTKSPLASCDISEFDAKDRQVLGYQQGRAIKADLPAGTYQLAVGCTRNRHVFFGTVNVKADGTIKTTCLDRSGRDVTIEGRSIIARASKVQKNGDQYSLDYRPCSKRIQPTFG
jgi:hypothetical protein